MYIELFINGSIKRLWRFDDPPAERLSQLMFLDRKIDWEKKVINCLAEAGSIIYEAQYVDIFIKVKASVQPKDINDSVFNDFLVNLSNKRANAVVKQYQPKIDNNGKLI